MTTMTEEPTTETPELSPLQSASKGDLIKFALLVEGMGQSVADYGKQLTAELTDRARRELADEGTRPSWDSKGFGRITLAVPDVSVKVGNERNFAEWLAQSKPEQVTAHISVSPADLANILALLEEQGYGDDVLNTTLEVRPAYVATYTDLKKGGVAVLADDGRKIVVDTATGEEVPGLVAQQPREPYITRTLDKTAKANMAEAMDAFLTDRLARGVPVDSALGLLGITAPVEAEPEGFEVEPEFEVVATCRCTHTAGSHRKGAKRFGKCLTTDCACIRFEESTE